MPETTRFGKHKHVYSRCSRQNTSPRAKRPRTPMIGPRFSLYALCTSGFPRTPLLADSAHLLMRPLGGDLVAVELQETHEDRHGRRNVECNPRPMQRLKLLSCLPQVVGGMDRRSFYEHDLVPGPEKSHRKQPLAQNHEHAEENPLARRLHAPAQDRGSDASNPREE